MVSLTTHYSLQYLLLTTFTTHYLLLTAHYLPLTTYYLLVITTYHLLPTGRQPPFEQELEEAEEHSADLPEEQLLPLPSDLLDRVQMLGLTPTRDQQRELDRRRFMKACSDHRARLSRHLPEYIEAFRIPSVSDFGGSFDSANSKRVWAWERDSRLGGSALDCDLGLRVSSFSAMSMSLSYSAQPLHQLHRCSSPPNERFWLTEAELSNPQLRAQRLQDVLPHIEHELLLQQREAEARVQANEANLAAITAAGLELMEMISQRTDTELSSNGFTAAEIEIVRNGPGAHHTQQQILRVQEYACSLTEIEANKIIWEQIERYSFMERRIGLGRELVGYGVKGRWSQILITKGYETHTSLRKGSHPLSPPPCACAVCVWRRQK